MGPGEDLPKPLQLGAWAGRWVSELGESPNTRGPLLSQLRNEVWMDTVGVPLCRRGAGEGRNFLWQWLPSTQTRSLTQETKLGGYNSPASQ